MIKEAGGEDGCDKARGDLLYEVAVKASACLLGSMLHIVPYKLLDLPLR